MANQRKKFRAQLEKDRSSLGWTIVHLPFDPSEVWKDMIRLRVKGTIQAAGGEASFRTSLFPASGETGAYFLLVNGAMQKASGAVLGATAEFVLEPDLEERPADLPDQLAALLDDEPGLREWYGELTEYHRREIGKWVHGVKSEEARQRRAQQMAERLLAAMEGERELPPVIEAAFRKHPKARAGWQKMTTTQRRNELMAVFYYQTPEAREKRVAKLCEMAAAKA